MEGVAAGGLRTRECTFEFDDEGGGRITHARTESSFAFKGAGFFEVTLGVGDSPLERYTHLLLPEVTEQAQQWATRVKANDGTRDLWAEHQRERELLNSARYENVEDTRFTPEERDEIAEQLRKIKESLRGTHLLTEDVAARLDYMEEASRHATRKQWWLMFCGTLFTVIVTDLLPPDTAQDVFAIALRGLGHIFGFGPPGLPPGT